MELFHDGSNREVTIRECAEQLIAVVPAVMGTFRGEMRAGRPSEISVPQFRALIHLQCRPGVSISDIAGHLGLALSTTSQLIDGLYKRQYVTRETAARDRRCAIVSLTEHGRAMLEAIRARTQVRMEERMASFTPAERLAVVMAMEALSRVFHKGLNP